MNLQALKNDLETFDPISGLDGYLSTRKSEKERIEQARAGTIPQGLTTGYLTVDQHFRFKQGNLVIMNGHDNVGKSFIAWYLMVIASFKYGWRWIMFCAENESPDIRTQLAEFLCGKLAKFVDDKEFDIRLDFVYDHFEIIEISDEKEEVETYDFISSLAQRIIDESEKTFNGVLFDPYNAFEIDMSKMDRRLSTHDYHYSCANKMRKFKKRNDMAVWVNMHAVSEALRRVDKDGYPLPPGKADTEGGGKFSNKADEFITWHRYVQDAERSRTTEMHVRKVKDTKTGGRCTDLKNPVLLNWETHNGFSGFYDDGVCPLAPKADSAPKVEKFPEVPSNFDMEKAHEMIEKYDNEEAPF